MNNLLCNVAGVPYDAAGNTDTCKGIIFSPYGDVKTKSTSMELYFYITAADVEDGLKLRLNKLSGKVEFVE